MVFILSKAGKTRNICSIGGLPEFMYVGQQLSINQ